jgi:cation:H+ antiporter
VKSIAILVISLGIILLGAEVFVNGIEWLGKKLNLSEGAVGSVLAAVGTALPETLIPIIAIVINTIIVQFIDFALILAINIFLLIP